MVEKFCTTRELAALIATLILTPACLCQGKGPHLDGSAEGRRQAAQAVVSQTKFNLESIRRDLQEFTASPHPLGSERQQELALYLAKRIESEGARPIMQGFTADVPNPRASEGSSAAELKLMRKGTNIYAPAGLIEKPSCFVLIGSHYDTKIVDGLSYVGANDSGSSSVALLQLLATLKRLKAEPRPFLCDLALVWFDGEEAHLSGWFDGERHPAKQQDNTYGSRHAVARLQPCLMASQKALCAPSVLGFLGGKPIVALILLDMIGSPAIRLARDSMSSARLLTEALHAAETIGEPAIFGPEPKSVEDDHVPFRKAGIPAINLIDFTNLEFWHRPGDESAQIDFNSIEKASKIGLFVALAVAHSPQVLAPSAD